MAPIPDENNSAVSARSSVASFRSTLTTVGFEEVRPLDDSGRVFTLTLIAIGVGLVLILVLSGLGVRLWLRGR